ncbi:hypothetical protein B0A52_05609 [Exophiala mesophila]|uniref:Uncharacterized protein n=1 Tax=Exophiala mesophila TaxID=212818 RepID=A0A438N3R8_EXOME|nr:hypothetical protein B0A52_05609 [Exophiala mesophila]
MAGFAHAHQHTHPPPYGYDAPPSPTLTNPDMILPYNPFLSTSPVPLPSSPTLHVISSPPPRPDSAVSLSSAQGDPELPLEFGVATPVRLPLRSVPPLNTDFNNYEHGAPLSDIGEEATPVSTKSMISYTSTVPDPPSPTPAARTPVLTDRPRTLSSSSSGSDVGDWEDFETSRIMNGRLAADVAKAEEEDADANPSKRNSAITTTAEDDMVLLNERAERILEHARERLVSMEDNLTKARHSILMSPRSSPNMNDVHQPAGGLYRSISLAGINNRKSRSLYPLVRINSVTHSRGGSDSTPNTALKRLSIIPERSASALEYGRRQEPPQQHQHSPQQRLHQEPSPSSRLVGNSPASSSRTFNSPLRTLKEADATPDTPSSSNTSPEDFHPRGLGINTLAAVSKENISMVTSSPTTAIARSPSATSTRSTKEIREQMTGLRARISDLKEKAQADGAWRRSIQSARTPSPFTNSQSPEQWYTGSPEYKAAKSPINTNAGVGWSPTRHQRDNSDSKVLPLTPQAQMYLSVEQPTTDNSRLLSEARTDKNTPSFHKSIPLADLTAVNPHSVIQESHYEDAAQQLDDEDAIAASEEEQIYLNEVLQESLEEIEPEVPEVPDHLLNDGAAERHEDRLDAFDYENMFLHSAMGNYSGTGTRSLTPSESDGSSVVTTRMYQNTPSDDGEDDGDETAVDTRDDQASTPVQESFSQSVVVGQSPPHLTAPPKPWMKPLRSNSMDSLSTQATFATAAEDDAVDARAGAGEGEDSDDETPDEILQWGNGAGTGFPQPPVSPRRDRATSNWPISTLAERSRPDQDNSPQKAATTRSVLANGNPTPPRLSPQASFPVDQGPPETQQHHPPEGLTSEPPVDHPANTEILMESLIKLADPDFGTREMQGPMRFSEVDKDLVLDLLRAVGGVCNNILKAERKQEVRTVKVLRRRLDESRKLLEGPGED